MSDNRSESGSQDRSRSRISLGGDCEVRDWREIFGVAPAELEAAAKAVGNPAAAVQAHLNRTQR